MPKPTTVTVKQQLDTIMSQGYIATAYLSGPEFIIETLNDLMSELWGRPKQLLRGKPLIGAMPELAGQGFDELLHRVITSGEAYSAKAVPAKHYRSDQAELETLYWDFSYLPVKDDTGVVQGIIIVASNVTEEALTKQHIVTMTKNIENDRQRLYNVFRQAPAMVAVLRGPNHTFELANEPYTRVVAGSRDLIGLTVREALPEVVEQGFIDILDGVYATGTPFVGTEVFIELDSSNTGKLEGLYLNFIYQPTRNTDGEIEGIFVHVIDVTEQVLARRYLEDTVKRLAMSQEGANIGSFEVDLATGILDGTPKLAELFGISMLQLAGAYLNQPNRIHPDELTYIRSVLDTAQAEHTPFIVEYRVIWPGDKSEHWVQTRGQYEYDETGKAIRFVGVVMDISERKTLERQKDDFIAIASHELKTPVTSIKAYAQIMERRFKKNNQAAEAESMARINAQLDKLTNLIGDLLDITKVDTGKLELQISKINFDELVSEVVEQVQLTTDSHDITIHNQTGKSITADGERIGQVITNLLSNAIKYSPNARPITVNLSSDTTSVTARVTDQGIGIDDDRREAVFERFFRVSGPNMQSFPGLGLGLYISAEIVKRLGGKIWVESETGKGSSFYVTLPIEPGSHFERTENHHD